MTLVTFHDRELDNNKEGEIQEMVEIYVDRGMTEEDAEVSWVG